MTKGQVGQAVKGHLKKVSSFYLFFCNCHFILMFCRHFVNGLTTVIRIFFKIYEEFLHEQGTTGRISFKVL